MGDTEAEGERLLAEFIAKPAPSAPEYGVMVIVQCAGEAPAIGLRDPNYAPVPSEGDRP